LVFYRRSSLVWFFNFIQNSLKEADKMKNNTCYKPTNDLLYFLRDLILWSLSLITIIGVPKLISDKVDLPVDFIFVFWMFFLFVMLCISLAIQHQIFVVKGRKK
jgi:hypothetical protein